jgi:hypothetical protein
LPIFDIIEQVFAQTAKMQLFLVLLFALAFESCVALPSLKTSHFAFAVAGTVLTALGGLYISHTPQNHTDIPPFGSELHPRGNGNFSSATVPKAMRINATILTENTTRAAAIFDRLVSPECVQDTTTPVPNASMHSQLPLRANDTNTSIVAGLGVPNEQPASDHLFTNNRGGLPTPSTLSPPRIFSLGLAPALFFGSDLVIIVLLVTYQLLVYGSSFHHRLYALVGFILAKLICLSIYVAGELPPYLTDAKSSIFKVSTELFSQLPKCFDFNSSRNAFVGEETVLGVLRKLRKLDGARYRQTLEAKRLCNFRRKRRVNANATYRRAAQGFKKCHENWQAIFENGITDIRQKLSDYTQLERQLKSKAAACTEAEQSLATYIAKICGLMATLDSQMALLSVALPKSTESLEDIQSLVKQINKLLAESESAELQVKRAERITKTLYNVSARMQMAHFKNSLKSIAEASAEAQRVIYNAESAIVAASLAQRNPNQIFELAIVAAREAQLPASLALLPGDLALDTKTSGEKLTPPRPPSLSMRSGISALDVERSDGISKPQRSPSPAVATGSLPFMSCPRPPSPLVSTKQHPRTQALPSPPSPPSKPPPMPQQTAQRPSTPPLMPASAEPSAGPLAVLYPPPSPFICPPAEPSAAPQAVQRHPSPSPIPVSAELTLEQQTAQFPPTLSFAAALQKPSPPPQENVVRLPAPIMPNTENITHTPPADAPSRPLASMDPVQSFVPAEPKDESVSEAPAPPPVPSPVEPKNESISEVPSEPTPAADRTEPEDEMVSEAPPEPTPLFAPATLNGERTNEIPPMPALAPPDTTMEDHIPPSFQAESRDESMADAPTTLAPPPPTTNMENAASGKAWVRHFGQLPEAQQRADATTFFNDQLATSNRSLTFSSRTQELGEFKPKVPMHRWNAPKHGILQKPTLSATSTGIEAPLSVPRPNSVSEFKAPIVAAPEPRMAYPSPTLTTSAPSKPTTSEPVPKAVPPKSKRINQAVFDQIQATGGRRIRKPVSRLPKAAPLDFALRSTLVAQPQGRPVAALDAASESTPVDDYYYPEFDGDYDFDGFLAQNGGCDYDGDSAHNGEFAYNGNHPYDSSSACNDSSAYSRYSAYNIYNDDDDAYGPSNVVYPMGTEEVLGPVDDYQIDIPGLDNYDFISNDGIPASYTPQDDVSRMVDADRIDADHVDDCLLAERDDYDSDGDDYNSDGYRSDSNGYGSYGNLSDYDSDQS